LCNIIRFRQLIPIHKKCRRKLYFHVITPFFHRQNFVLLLGKKFIGYGVFGGKSPVIFLWCVIPLVKRLSYGFFISISGYCQKMLYRRGFYVAFFSGSGKDNLYLHIRVALNQFVYYRVRPGAGAAVRITNLN